MSGEISTGLGVRRLGAPTADLYVSNLLQDPVCPLSSADLGFWAERGGPLYPFWFYIAEICLKRGSKCFYSVAMHILHSKLEALIE